MKQYKKMKNARRIQGTPVQEKKPTEATQETTQEEKQEKVFLSELEKEKLIELHKQKEALKSQHTKNGELKTQLTLYENEAVQLAVNCANNEQKIMIELQQKYGQFQLGENFEVIKTFDHLK